MILNSEWIKQIFDDMSVTNIDETLAEQRKIIDVACQYIVFLTIMRAAVVRSDEARSVSKKNAEKVIDDALANVNSTPKPRFTNEGGMN